MTVGNVKRGITRGPGQLDGVEHSAYDPLTYNIEYLIVGGGGGGGDVAGTLDAGGGGEGGEVLASASFAVSVGVLYSIIVGAAVGPNTIGANSYMDGVGSALGGIQGQGTGAGGTGRLGGDGGAGNLSGNAGTGSVGTLSSITGISIGYGGGGGGAAYSADGSAFAGAGQHGGGNGEKRSGADHLTVVPATNGAVNSGGGGGGSGGSGGSGIVILRILTTNYTGQVTGSPIVTTDGDYKVVKFTVNGTYTA